MTEVKLNDVIRFGRIPFKIIKFVLDVKKDIKSQKNRKENMKTDFLTQQKTETINDSNYPLHTMPEQLEGGSDDDESEGPPEENQPQLEEGESDEEEGE